MPISSNLLSSFLKDYEKIQQAGFSDQNIEEIATSAEQTAYIVTNLAHALPKINRLMTYCNIQAGQISALLKNSGSQFEEKLQQLIQLPNFHHPEQENKAEPVNNQQNPIHPAQAANHIAPPAQHNIITPPTNTTHTTKSKLVFSSRDVEKIAHTPEHIPQVDQTLKSYNFALSLFSEQVGITSDQLTTLLSGIGPNLEVTILSLCTQTELIKNLIDNGPFNKPELIDLLKESGPYTEENIEQLTNSLSNINGLIGSQLFKASQIILILKSVDTNLGKALQALKENTTELLNLIYFERIKPKVITAVIAQMKSATFSQTLEYMNSSAHELKQLNEVPKNYLVSIEKQVNRIGEPLIIAQNQEDRPIATTDIQAINPVIGFASSRQNALPDEVIIFDTQNNPTQPQKRTATVAAFETRKNTKKAKLKSAPTFVIETTIGGKLYTIEFETHNLSSIAADQTHFEKVKKTLKKYKQPLTELMLRTKLEPGNISSMLCKSRGHVEDAVKALTQHALTIEKIIEANVFKLKNVPALLRNSGRKIEQNINLLYNKLPMFNEVIENGVLTPDQISHMLGASGPRFNVAVNEFERNKTLFYDLVKNKNIKPSVLSFVLKSSGANIGENINLVYTHHKDLIGLENAPENHLKNLKGIPIKTKQFGRNSKQINWDNPLNLNKNLKFLTLKQKGFTEKNIAAVANEGQFKVTVINAFYDNLDALQNFMNKTGFSPSNITSMLKNSRSNTDQVLKTLLSEEKTLKNLIGQNKFKPSNLASILFGSAVRLKENINQLNAVKAQLFRIIETNKMTANEIAMTIHKSNGPFSNKLNKVFSKLGNPTL